VDVCYGKRNQGSTDENGFSGYSFCGIKSITHVLGAFVVHGIVDTLGKEHLMLTMGDIGNGEPVLVPVRIHSECLTGDALFSLRCDCGFQLRTAMERIGDVGRGVVIYLRQEGAESACTTRSGRMDCRNGADTVDANLQLGFAADTRDYAICKPMLERIGVHRLRLMTNNSAKMVAMHDLGFDEVERVAVPAARNPHNEAYLDAKERRMSHISAGHG